MVLTKLHLKNQHPKHNITGKSTGANLRYIFAVTSFFILSLDKMNMVKISHNTAFFSGAHCGLSIQKELQLRFKYREKTSTEV